MKWAMVLAAAILAVGCEGPYAYAESWEHNTCPEDIPSDPEEALGAAIDRIESRGFRVRWKSMGMKARTDTISKIVWLDHEKGDADSAWHELVHVRQYRDGLTGLAGVDGWDWALEVHAMRQDLLSGYALDLGYGAAKVERMIEGRPEKWGRKRKEQARSILLESLDGCE